MATGGQQIGRGGGRGDCAEPWQVSFLGTWTQSSSGHDGVNRGWAPSRTRGLDVEMGDFMPSPERHPSHNHQIHHLDSQIRGTLCPCLTAVKRFLEKCRVKGGSFPPLFTYSSSCNSGSRWRRRSAASSGAM